MVALRHMLSGFLGGELDPLMSGRVETDQYNYGLEICENFACINEGPLVKRPGFAYVCDAAPSSTWLSAFRRSIDQEYVIEWGEAIARFYTNDLRIETAPGVAYEIAVPYAAAEAPYLSLQQSFDRLYIDHPSHPPAALARTDAVTFVHANSVLVSGPFADGNVDEPVTVEVSATTGTGITITASDPIFLAGHVGAPFRIEAEDFSDIKAWEVGMKEVVVGDIVRSDGKAYEAEEGDITGTIQPTHTSGSAWDGQGRKDEASDKGPYGVKWKYLHDRFGTVTITGVGGGGTTATADVVRRLPGSLTTVPSWRWAHGAFSAAAGWPAHVVHAYGRQIHFKDFDLVASVVGDYGGGSVNFATFTSSGLLAADLAFRRRLDTADPPLWVARDNKKLLLGTATAEIAIGAINSALAVSGDNIEAAPQSFYGSEAVRPLQIGTETLFVELSGRRIRAADYDFGRDRYLPVDLTAAARHVTKGGVVQLAYQRVPHGLVHALRGDGQVACHAKTRIDVKGWSRTVLGGAAVALSAVSVVGADAKTDSLWLLVERQRADGLRKEIWRQMPWRELGEDQREAFYVDGGLRIAAAGGQSLFTGLGRFAGQAVAVLSDGGVVKGLSVSNAGELALPANAVRADPFTVIVGLGFTARAVTLRPEPKPGGQVIQGLLQRVRKAVLRLLDSLGVKVGDGGGELMENVIDRPASADMDAAIPLFSGDTPGYVDMEIATDGRATFLSDVPLPAVIAAATLSLEVDQADA